MARYLGRDLLAESYPPISFLIHLKSKSYQQLIHYMTSMRPLCEVHSKWGEQRKLGRRVEKILAVNLT